MIAAEPDDPSWARSAPRRIGRYRLGAPLGAGGGGAVYRVEVDDGEPLAMKLMLPQWAANDVMVGRFEREIETLSRLDHPNVVQILDHGRLPDGRLWYVMPRLIGTDLDALLNRQGRLAVEEALAMMDAVCSALAAAHEAGVIHRDLKASNVFVGSGDVPRITLLDFGAARADTSGQQKGLTVAGTIVGTPTSMAPEQIVGFDPDVRTDVYAAGVLLFRMLTGRYPFHATTTEQIMLDHLSTPPPRPSELAAMPAALESIVLRCLEKRAEDRFATATELGAALRAVAGTSTSTSTSTIEIRVVAVHVELLAPEHVVEACGLDALELSATRLVDGRFELALGVGGSVLGIAPAGADAALALAHAGELATALLDDLLRRVNDQLAPRIVIHLGDARGTAESWIDGDVAEVDGWLDASLPQGVHFSSAARALLGPSMVQA